MLKSAKRGKKDRSLASNYLADCLPSIFANNNNNNKMRLISYENGLNRRTPSKTEAKYY